MKEFERVPGAALARENFLQRPHAACVTLHDFGVPGSPECDFGPVTSTFWARTPVREKTKAAVNSNKEIFARRSSGVFQAHT